MDDVKKKETETTSKVAEKEVSVNRVVLENSLPCFVNEKGNLMLVMPDGEKINPLFSDKLYWLKRVAYSVGISPAKVEKIIRQARGEKPVVRGRARKVRDVKTDNNKEGEEATTKKTYEIFAENLAKA